MSVIKNNPKFKELETRKIFEYLIERESILIKDAVKPLALKEVKKLLVYIVTSYARSPHDGMDTAH